ncbi:sel1 repeat family protein [Saccharobesus litoralis]|uniref:Sel1 repeat family protein n=1 Tax=Saccharobesus litoralis TaxID=2172099 RepID=A0A2S0VPD1_9ALTE|nr:SEL1-like repeat protein [Saccharobesus litoralis]AWB66066.1 sel1 repeat family protein [Saccharobesus litoralis]
MLSKPYKSLILLAAIYCIGSANASIFKADKHYTSKEYELAKKGYLNAAKVGNPHAYYQLGQMYRQGQGVKPDLLNALIYFALAEEYDFHSSQKILNQLLESFTEIERQKIIAILDDYKRNNGKSQIEQKYYPELIVANLQKKVLFDGESKLKTRFYADEYDAENEMLNASDFGFDDEESNDLYGIVSTPKLPYLIVDNDIGRDGSVRYVSEVQKSGSVTSIIKQYKLFAGPKPTFDGKPVEFVNRVSMGAANFDRFALIRENEKLYGAILRAKKKLVKDQSLKSQYELAMALQNFPWLEQEEGEVEKRLLDLSKQGHPSAMFEYGAKLYREQRDLDSAVKWISRASSYGLARAEYRLGKLLTTSPWVKQDEKKALFWFESAMVKDHIAATIKVIELKLLAKDKSLHDLDTAIKLLEKIESSQTSNPEYFYLLSLSHIDRKNRDYTQVIANLEHAITLASRFDWDVAEWESLLGRLTQGTVYITE